jgi:hypothetical protein
MNLQDEIKQLQKTAGILKEGVVGQPQGAPVQQSDRRSGDVKAYDKGQTQATALKSKATAINNVQEFQDTFKVWVKSLGMNSKKFSKSQLRSAVEKALVELGYK